MKTNKPFPPILHGRVVDVPRPEFPTRICVLVEDQMVILQLPSDRASGMSEKIRLGDLVRIELEGGNASPPIVEKLAKIGGPPEGRWSEQGDGLRWRRPEAEQSRMSFLRQRHKIIREIRTYFDEQGFVEVETPTWVVAPNPEPQFDVVPAGEGHLITSPEFHLKRLLVGGMEKIYRLGPVFRGAEVGQHHNPEFTLLEWYRAHEGLESMSVDLEAICARVAPFMLEEVNQGIPKAVLEGGKFPQRPVAELFTEYLGLNLQGVTTVAGLRDSLITGIKTGALEPGLPSPEDLPEVFEQAFFMLWDKLETRFPPTPLLVTEWPAPLASLARLKPEDPTVALRMELYAGGLELANGFDELTDAVEQRQRFEADITARQEAGLPQVKLDEKFLAALEQGMPPAAGMALGIDRLVMLLTGATHIRQVLPFDFDER